MKKEYINPTMEVVEMKMRSQLMAGSLTGTVKSEDAEVDGEGYYQGI